MNSNATNNGYYIKSGSVAADYRCIELRDGEVVPMPLHSEESRYAYDYNRLAVALRELPLNDTALQAIEIICRVLKEQNPRFDAGMFSEWALENK